MVVDVQNLQRWTHELGKACDWALRDYERCQDVAALQGRDRCDAGSVQVHSVQRRLSTQQIGGKGCQGCKKIEILL